MGNNGSFSEYVWGMSDETGLMETNPDLFIPQIGHFIGVGNFQRHYFVNHECCIIAEKGEAELSLGSHKFHLKAGDLAFIFRSDKVRMKESEKSPLSYYWFDLKGSKVTSVLKQFGITNKKPYFKGNYFDKLSSFLKEVESTYKEKAYSNYFPSVCAWKFVEFLSKHFKEQKAEGKPKDLAVTASWLMHKSFHQQICVESVAEQLGVSRVTLFKKFKQKYGVTPSEFLEKVRMEHAKKLLLLTKSSISEISFECGYQNIHHFSRAFRRRFNCPPTKWRHDYQEP